MNIGLDGKKALSNFTGIGNYSRNHINLLTRNKDFSCTLFAPRKGKEECLKALNEPESISIVTPLSGSSISRNYWRNFSIVKDIRKSGVDIYHGLSNEIPFGIADAGCLSAVTIHDLIFLRYPDTYDFLSRKLLEIKTKYACRHADAIVAVSEQTKRDIIDFYGVPAEKITVLYQGCHDVFRRKVSLDEISAIRQTYGIPEKYIVSVGTIEHRKNHSTIVKAFSQAGVDATLVLVSKPTRLQKELESTIRELGIGDKVKILNNVPLEHLPALYQGSIASVYASYFEGFGIPVLEGLTSGVPVIAATGSCLEEAGGEGAVYVNPFDVREMAEAMSRVVSDSELRCSLVAGGQKHLSRFTEEALAANVYDFYRRLYATKSGR